MLFVRHKDGRIEVASHLPTAPRWIGTIQLTPDLKLTIVDLRSSGELFVPPTAVRPYSVHILKSNLQKCVRRRDYPRAVVTGWQLLCQDPIELLRRLPVIIAEDSLVHPQLYPGLVWLMAAASKGYRLTWNDATLIMASLATAVGTTERVAIYAVASRLTPPLTPLSVALMIRAEFGGMEHDRAFLWRLAHRPDLPADTADPAWVEHDIDPLDPAEHILLDAIDQHCCPRVLREVTTVHPQAIWWCRSSLNCRPIVGFGAEEATAIGIAKRKEHAANLESHRAALNAFARRQIARGWVIPPVCHTKKAPASVVCGPMDVWLKKAT